MPTNNPLEVLNNQRKFLFASCGKNYYFRVITKPEDMQARHDCTELLRKMLNILECKNSPLGLDWDPGYESRVKSTNRCVTDNYTYFVLEDEVGKAIGILSGDIYPNNNPSEQENNKPAINAKNFFIEDQYRGLGFGQMMLSKIPTIIAKRVGIVTKIIKGLSKESIEAGNLERYQKYSDKANLTSEVTDKQNKMDGKLLVVQACLSYQEAKGIAKSFKQLVASKHELDIDKSKERKGWRCVPSVG